MSELVFPKNLAEVKEIIKTTENAFAVIDENVYKLYPDIVENKPRYVFESTEENKCLSKVEKICEQMLNSGLNRKSAVIAIGGGIVGDVAGFAASMYMRGVRWINIPTTLLAQVDSSIGGKTGCNLGGVKNILGAFHKPSKVIICSEFLKTLSEREWLCGLGEIIKTAFLDEKLYARIKTDFDAIKNRDSAVMKDLIKELAEFKDNVTVLDPTEKGLRKILNLGHTVGHALEKCDGHARSHGEYVLLGLEIEAYICRNLSKWYYPKVREFLDGFNIKPLDFDVERVVKTALSDKKNVNGISVMYATGAGEINETEFCYDRLKEELYGWRKTNCK